MIIRLTCRTKEGEFIDSLVDFSDLESCYVSTDDDGTLGLTRIFRKTKDCFHVKESLDEIQLKIKEWRMNGAIH